MIGSTKQQKKLNIQYAFIQNKIKRGVFLSAKQIHENYYCVFHTMRFE